DLAVLLAERWLEWFFCAFRLRPLLKSVTRDGKPLHPRAGEELRTLMRALEAPQPDLHGVRSSFLVAERASVLSRTPALPSVLAEMLLDRGAEPEALEVLNKAREHFADDLRLNQLRGLCHKRRGKLNDALTIMEPLHERHPNDDETNGIYAGICK